MASETVLDVRDLQVEFKTEQGIVKAVRDISFHVNEGEILGIVGESGSGKSVSMYAVMGLLADNGKVVDGKIRFLGDEIGRSAFPNARAYEDKMSKVRGNTMAMIFQDPMTFLNPVLTIGKQLMEPILNHTQLSRAGAKEKALQLMRDVGIPNSEHRFRQYPHQFSGGMRQRIIIAIAIANSPRLIIADEPTTALDVTIQAQILDLLKDMTRRLNSSTIMITHDLGVVASLCDRINIMYGGKIVETGTDQEIFYDAKHPYTQGLLGCIHNPEAEDRDLMPIPGSPPDLLAPPAGCPFVDRCPHAMRICKVRMPEVTKYTETHECACWLNEKERRQEGKGGAASGVS